MTRLQRSPVTKVFLSKAEWNVLLEAGFFYGNQLERKSPQFSVLWDAWRKLRAANDTKRFCIEVENQ